MRKLAIVQARFESARLPGKVLADIGGQPMLVRVLERARRAQTLDGVVVATSVQPSDDTVARVCDQRGYQYFRGHAQDVLDRYYQAARTFGVDIIVRITADCPVIDPGVIDRVVLAFLGLPNPEPDGGQTGSYSEIASGLSAAQLPYDFAANRLPPPWKRSYPIGLDVEVCTFQALQQAWENAGQGHQREHVMPYLYEQEGRFRVLLVDYEQDCGSYRLTVDTAEDLQLLRQVYANFGNRDDFSWLEVLALFERQPELMKINADVPHKIYNQVDERYDANS